jgi:hypothetical protein
MRTILKTLLRKVGKQLALYLDQPISHYGTFDAPGEKILAATLQPGDILLVEGNTRVSKVIKYVTQSIWSHAAIYVGDRPELTDHEGNTLIEVDIVEGVIASPLSKYADLNTRICRPVAITDKDREKMLDYITGELGHTYDLKNIIDLLRFYVLLPAPARFRRQMLALGSGDPTKAICSTLIAQAFQHIRYPILPRHDAPCSESECLAQRHYSHFTPSDFDLSPYFNIVKPTIENRFNYKKLHWAS